MKKQNKKIGNLSETSIFGPLPKAAHSVWNLVFISLAVAFITLAWHTKYAESLECKLVSTQSDHSQLTLMATNKNFDFGLLNNDRPLSLEFQNDDKKVKLPIQVKGLNQTIIEKELQILLEVNHLIDNNVILPQQGRNIRLVIEENRLLEKLISPIKTIIERSNY